MIGHLPHYQARPPRPERPDADEGRLRLRDEAVQAVGRTTGCCYPEDSFDAVLDWISANAESIWRQADRPAFGGSGDLQTMVDALRPGAAC